MSSVDWMRNSRQTAKSLESKQNGQQSSMKCVVFIHFPLDFLNVGKSGVQVHLVLYEISKFEHVHTWMHLAGFGVMLQRPFNHSI